MIETPVPMDIRKYKTKLLAGLTTRQLICGAICAVLDAGMYFLAFKPIGMDIQTTIFAMTLLDVPIMAFTLDFNGMTMETYLMKVLLRNFVVPTKRRAASGIIEKKPDKQVNEKAVQKKLKPLLKKHPEYIAYK